MKIQFSDIFSVLALVISVTSIWLQNRGVRQQLLVSNVSEYTKRYGEIFEKLPQSILDNSFNLDSLPENEKEKVLRTLWLYFDLCYEEYILFHELRLVDKKLWGHWESAMTSAFSRPAFYQSWQVIFNESFYPKPFSKFVSEKMAELHNPGRRLFVT